MPVKRQHAGPSTGPKRTRFASPSDKDSIEPEDNLLEEDLPENAAQKKNRSKKQLKDQDGYGSDSSNDDEGVVNSRRPGAKDDDDVDMFADEPEEKPDKGKGKAKEKDFLNLEDIEGQELEEQPEVDDDIVGEDDNAKRQRALGGDMGIDITPFNMKAEMDEGRFTEGGEVYVENNKDPNEKHDVWLQDLDEDVIEKAKQAHEAREKIERKREEAEADLEGSKDKQSQMMAIAVELMERGETILEALQRLGKEVEDRRKKDEAGQKKKSWAEKQKERKAAASAEASQGDSFHTSNPFTNLSNIVSAMTSIGHLDVYSLSRESIQRMLPQPSNGTATTPQPPAPARDTRQFQYRFSVQYIRSLPESQRPVEREIFGPFPITQLQQWRGTGFFGGPACENVELKKVGDNGPWGTWTDVVG